MRLPGGSFRHSVVDSVAVHTQVAVVVEDQPMEAGDAGWGDGRAIQHLRAAIGVDRYLVWIVQRVAEAGLRGQRRK
jgi:hypothetical protein